MPLHPYREQTTPRRHRHTNLPTGEQTAQPMRHHIQAPAGERTVSWSARWPASLLERMRQLAEEHQRSMAGEFALALRAYLALFNDVSLRCRLHPHAPVRYRTTAECSVCHAAVEERVGHTVLPRGAGFEGV